MSPQQQLSQKLNALLSTGPRSEEGKTISSQNRVTHGLCSKKHAIHRTQRPEFERHYNEMLAALAPVGAEECQLAEAIILDQYRLARARDLENEIFIKGIAEAEDSVCPNAETWVKHGKDLALLTVYSQRIHRVLVRNQADFAAKQTARKAAEHEQIAQSKAEAATPSSVGFVRLSARPAEESARVVAQPAPAIGHAPVPIAPPSLSIAA